MTSLGSSVAFCASLLLIACSQSAEQPTPVAEDRSAVASPRPIAPPFPDAVEVRLFVDSGKYVGGRPIWTHEKGVTLTAAQRKSFEAALRVEPMPDSLAGCFIPHHFFRYFDSDGRKVGEFSVCFCCGGVRIDPASHIAVGADEWLNADYARLEDLVRSLDEPTEIGCD